MQHFMFKGSNISASILKKSLQKVVGELPVLAGRVRVVDPSNLDGLVVDCNNRGAEFVAARAPAVSIEEMGPHTWSQWTESHKVGEFPLPFYAEPFNIGGSPAPTNKTTKKS